MRKEAMKLESQVVSLGLAKKLKELDVKQDSFCYWLHREMSSETKLVFQSNYYPKDCVSAFTVAELGEMLPNWGFTIYREGEGRPLYRVGCDVSLLKYRLTGDTTGRYNDDLFNVYVDNPADGLATFYIHLIEKGIVKP